MVLFKQPPSFILNPLSGKRVFYKYLFIQCVRFSINEQNRRSKGSRVRGNRHCEAEAKVVAAADGPMRCARSRPGVQRLAMPTTAATKPIQA
ncbi:MAG: hypothetical protein ACMUJM_17505 [bacterium]